MKETLVLYPALGKGHLNSMIELAKLILTQNPSFSITILILTPPNTTNNTSTSSSTTFGCESFPSITFHHIPPINLPPTLPPQALPFELCHVSNNHVHHILQSISKTSNLKGVILDFFNYSTTQITNNLEIPTYFYYTSAASTLAIILQMPTIHQTTTTSFKDNLNMDLRIPGLPKIPLVDMPEQTKDRENKSYRVFIDIGICMRDSKGIILNTFDAIEERIIKALNKGLVLPQGTTPPLFCIGPMVSNSTTSCEKDETGCLSWLDSQPSRSVVLLSFGSLGTFSRTQLNEIAIGLEKSGQRFLWVVRSKNELVERVDSDGRIERVNSEEMSLEELLPKGFLERTKDKGMVVRNWAPQAAILSHDSVGGFVTHCGWNSVLEAVTNGIPMVTWPLYAEQKLNRVILVEEMKVALKLNELEDGFVTSTELGDRVKELMESESGKEIRERICKMKVSAKEAKAGGGSSLVDLKRLQDSWRDHASLHSLSPNSPLLYR